ncbi:hypothetical protein CR513_09609, partial [Mucuna pruriens]
MGYATHVESGRRSERNVSSMFTQSYSAILSSFNSMKAKFNQINTTLPQRIVPTGPNALHN